MLAAGGLLRIPGKFVTATQHKRVRGRRGGGGGGAPPLALSHLAPPPVCAIANLRVSPDCVLLLLVAALFDVGRVELVGRSIF